MIYTENSSRKATFFNISYIDITQRFLRKVSKIFSFKILEIFLFSFKFTFVVYSKMDIVAYAYIKEKNSQINTLLYTLKNRTRRTE